MIFLGIYLSVVLIYIIGYIYSRARYYREYKSHPYNFDGDEIWLYVLFWPITLGIVALVCLYMLLELLGRKFIELIAKFI